MSVWSTIIQCAMCRLVQVFGKDTSPLCYYKDVKRGKADRFKPHWCNQRKNLCCLKAVFSEISLHSKPTKPAYYWPTIDHDYWILLLSGLRVLGSRATAGRRKPSQEQYSAWWYLCAEITYLSALSHSGYILQQDRERSKKTHCTAAKLSSPMTGSK